MARVECPRCQRPLQSCFCQSLIPEPACTDLLILQHHKEVKHPLNTAKIADLGISNCTILIGEDFSQNETFQTLLATRKACLLFPSDKAQQPDTFKQNHGLPDLCILLDGTWRKARKMYYLNPELQSLPAINLSTTSESNYRIRKTPNTSALSTIEAAVTLLRDFSGQPEAHQQCLDSFEIMIDLQIGAMGKGVYEKNYSRR